MCVSVWEEFKECNDDMLFHRNFQQVDTPFKHLENWNVWLHQEAGEDQFSVQLQAATPLSHFSTLEAKGILE